MDRPRKVFRNQRLRKDYYNYFDICRLEGIPEMRAKNAVKVLGVEGIKNVKQLAPIEHLFATFERPIRGKMTYSYGILRRLYDTWKQTGKVPKQPPGRPIKKGYVWLKGYVPEQLKKEFTELVDRANAMSTVHVSYSAMIAIAVQEFLDRRPHLRDLDEKPEEEG